MAWMGGEGRPRSTPPRTKARPRGSERSADQPISKKDNGRDRNMSSDRRRPGAGLLAGFGLGALGDRPLEGRPATRVEWIHLLAVAVLGRSATSRRMEGSQLGKALLFGREGGLQGFRKLGVVHGYNPEPSLQLQDLNFGPGQFQIDGFGHCIPLLYGSKLLNLITTPQELKLCRRGFSRAKSRPAACRRTPWKPSQACPSGPRPCSAAPSAPGCC